MKVQKVQKLETIAIKTWARTIDSGDTIHNATRYTNWKLKQYDNRPNEVLEKIRKCKYPKRLY